jgi:hypothetical protein
MALSVHRQMLLQGVHMLTKSTSVKPAPHNFIGFGAIDVTKPYQFIGFGDIHGPEPYKLIRFGGIDVSNPYKFIGFGGI